MSADDYVRIPAGTTVDLHGIPLQLISDAWIRDPMQNMTILRQMDAATPYTYLCAGCRKPLRRRIRTVSFSRYALHLCFLCRDLLWNLVARDLASIGGSTSGKAKRRDVDYAALGRLGGKAGKGKLKSRPKP